MVHPRDHPARGRRVIEFDKLIHSPETHPANRLAHAARAANEADYPANFQFPRLFLRGHIRFQNLYAVTGSAVLPRSSLTLAASRKCSSASKVALITLCGFEVPIDLVNTFWIPATSITARTGPPAIMPVPSGAGFKSTWPEP